MKFQEIQNESLADEFMAMARAKGMNPRLRGTPDEERARTDAMLKQRAADRAAAPKPAGPDTEERARLEAKLKELEARFDPDFEYSDDYSFWTKQNELSKQIRSIKQRLAQGVAEAPIAATDEPNNPMIHGHQKANPMTLQGRIQQARNQLRDLADMADSNELVVWEKITKLAKGGMFMGLEQNLEQIRHGIEELAKKRRQGGTGSRGIDKNIG